MHIHEYQAKALLRERGVPVPVGSMAGTADEAGRAFDAIASGRAVVKAQIHAGGRGEAGGVIPVAGRAEAMAAAARLLGTSLVTQQTGPAGLPVERVLVEERLEASAEYYLSVSLDRENGCPIAMASARGGVQVEEAGLAEPGAMVTERGDPFRGMEPFQARRLCAGLDLPGRLLAPLASMVHTLARTFVELDCSLVEINPLMLCPGERLVAADTKMTFDDNACRLRPELAELRDAGQDDPREAEAAAHELSYVGLEGDIGCMVNGAGLAMATADLIRLHGGEPANFLDIGGGATAERVAAGFRLICADERVKVVLIDVFGGIVRCDLVAEGIIRAARETGAGLPLVVRLAGNHAQEGLHALAESGLDVAPFESFDEATARAVEVAAR